MRNTEKVTAPSAAERQRCSGCGKSISKSTGFYHITYNHKNDAAPTTLEEASKYAPEGYHLFGGKDGLRWDRHGRYIWGIRIWDGKSYGDKGRCSNCTPAAQARRAASKRMKETPTTRPRCLGCGKPLSRATRYHQFVCREPRDRLVSSIEEAMRYIPEGWAPFKGDASFHWMRGAQWAPNGLALPPGGDYIYGVRIWDGKSYGNAGHCAKCLPTREFMDEADRVRQEEERDRADMVPVRVVLEVEGVFSRKTLTEMIAETPEMIQEFVSATPVKPGEKTSGHRTILESVGVMILHDGEIIGQHSWSKADSGECPAHRPE